jgi:hypothetical protein
MKKKIAKQLEKIGASLVSTRFGILGDWMVVTATGKEIFFPTLGDVGRWIHTL